MIRELTAIAFAKGERDGVEIKVNHSIKAMELLCKLNGLLGGGRDEAGAGQLDALIAGLYGAGETED